MSRALIVLLAVVAAVYFFGNLATPWFDYRALTARADLSTAGFSIYMTTVWTALTHRAFAISVADDAVRFEMSWLGIIVVIAALLFLRLFRR